LNANTKHVLSCIYDQLEWNKKKDRLRGLGLLRNDIAAVPTNRLLALGVSETTRNRALRELERAGFIERLPAKSKFAVTRVRVLKY
jgi:DNA-binding transcriptional regulator YhcF (GntR family)